MAQFLKAHEIGSGALKPFLLANAERVKANAQSMAEMDGRPFQYLSSSLRKEDTARKLGAVHQLSTDTEVVASRVSNPNTSAPRQAQRDTRFLRRACSNVSGPPEAHGRAAC